jgi:hypothetical protein
MVLAGGRQYDEEDGHGEWPAKRERQVCDENEDGTTLRRGMLVGSLGGRCAGGRIFAT